MLKKILHILLFLLVVHPSAGQGKTTPLKKEVFRYIDTHYKQFIAYSDSIWAYAERSFNEHKSVALLIEILKKEGFTVQQNVCGVATMFVASYGNSKPVIGLFGEYDADSLASNKAVAWREELVKGGYGHGAGHNLLGVGSLATALSIKSLIVQRKLSCTIQYFGTTAEGGLGSKTYLARYGYFSDLDLSMYWHPSPVTTPSPHSWDALIECKVTFTGEKVHAFTQPSHTKNTLDAAVLLLQRMQSLKQQPGTLRLNYLIDSGGKDIRYIADSTVVNIRVQGARQKEAETTFQKIRDLAQDAAKETGLFCKVTVTKAMHEFLSNAAAMKLVEENMQLLGPIRYSAQEQAYARQMQTYLALKPNGIQEQILAFDTPTEKIQMEGYASDIGDASWFAPEIYFVVCALPPVPMHSWPATAFTAHSIGHKAMSYAAKVMAGVIVDYVENDVLQQILRKEFKASTKHYEYNSILESASPPINNNSQTN